VCRIVDRANGRVGYVCDGGDGDDREEGAGGQEFRGRQEAGGEGNGFRIYDDYFFKEEDDDGQSDFSRYQQGECCEAQADWQASYGGEH
jgi:hypothetical protein